VRWGQERCAEALCSLGAQTSLRSVRAKLAARHPLYAYSQLAPARPQGAQAVQAGGVHGAAPAASERAALRWFGSLGPERGCVKHSSARRGPPAGCAGQDARHERRARRQQAAREAAAALALLSLGK